MASPRPDIPGPPVSTGESAQAEYGDDDDMVVQVDGELQRDVEGDGDYGGILHNDEDEMTESMLELSTN